MFSKKTLYVLFFHTTNILCIPKVIRSLGIHENFSFKTINVILLCKGDSRNYYC